MRNGRAVSSCEDFSAHAAPAGEEAAPFQAGHGNAAAAFACAQGMGQGSPAPAGHFSFDFGRFAFDYPGGVIVELILAGNDRTAAAGAAHGIAAGDDGVAGKSEPVLNHFPAAKKDVPVLVGIRICHEASAKFKCAGRQAGNPAGRNTRQKNMLFHKHIGGGWQYFTGHGQGAA